ncbi:MAG: sec-independent protein translocase protein TatA [Actinomycetota bacterium]|nr:sec-independent protein translocase protein TatA [Actinomycetota bacterium]
MRAFEPWHFLVLLVVVAILFGSKRLPDAARGLGRSLRIFKAEVRELREDDDRRATGSAPSGSTTSGSAPSAPGPIEGRLVDPEPRRTNAPSEHRGDL